MTCDERKDLIFLYAADALEPAEQQDLRAHLADGCPECNGTLAEAQAMLAKIPMSLPPVQPPPEAMDRLMQRVAFTAGTKPKTNWLRYVAAACIGLIVGAVSIFAYLSPKHDRALKDALALATDRGTKVEELQRMLETEKLGYIKLAAATQTIPASGRVLWDQDRGEWHVFVFDLMPMKNGREYELWFIKPDQTKIAAGMIHTDDKGFGKAVVKVPDNIGPIALAAITDEPAGGVAVPTGAIHLVGKAD